MNGTYVDWVYCFVGSKCLNYAGYRLDHFDLFVGLSSAEFEKHKRQRMRERESGGGSGMGKGWDGS